MRRAARARRRSVTDGRRSRATLAVCVITLNEEDRIGDCLASVAFADEIIVVDSGSTDRTVEIARERGRPRHRARLAGVRRAEELRARAGDGRLGAVPRRRRAGLAAARGGDPRACSPRPRRRSPATSMPRRTFYLGRWILHGGWYPDRKVRLVRRGRARWGGRRPARPARSRGPGRHARAATSSTTPTATSRITCARSTASRAMARAASCTRAGGAGRLAGMLRQPAGEVPEDVPAQGGVSRRPARVHRGGAGELLCFSQVRQALGTADGRGGPERWERTT